MLTMCVTLFLLSSAFYNAWKNQVLSDFILRKLAAYKSFDWGLTSKCFPILALRPVILMKWTLK